MFLFRCHAKKRKPKRFAWLGRMFGCRQINPLTSKDHDIPLEPDSSQKSAFPCGDLSCELGSKLTNKTQLIIISNNLCNLKITLSFFFDTWYRGLCSTTNHFK